MFREIKNKPNKKKTIFWNNKQRRRSRAYFLFSLMY